MRTFIQNKYNITWEQFFSTINSTNSRDHSSSGLFRGRHKFMITEIGVKNQSIVNIIPSVHFPIYSLQTPQKFVSCLHSKLTKP
jgi:hypothetical protein